MKVLIITKKHMIISCFVFIAILTTVFCIFFNSNDDIYEASTTKRKLPIYAVNTNEKKIALSFDCAWENSDTEILIDILNKNNIKATFFTTGDFCKRYPEDIKKFYDNGHSIQNHSYNHPHVAKINAEKLIEDTKMCDDIITEITGVKPTLYRAPYGEYSDHMLITFEEKLDHKVIQWDVDSRDWQKREAVDMVRTVCSKVKNGSIILFHNDTKNTPQALMQIIPELKGKGYEFVLIEDLIYKDSYTLDHEGRQVKSVT